MKTRKTYIDILKIISIFLVMYVHTGADAMHRYLVLAGAGRVFSMIMYALAQCGPSVFFIVSGILLLNRDESLAYVFKHRVLRYVLVLAFFGLIQYFATAISGGTLNQVSPLGIIKTIYSTTVIEQYWFLYSYLVFLLLLPFLRGLAKNLTRESALYLLVLYFVFEVVMVIFEKLVNFDRTSLSPIPIFTNIIILPLSGFCLENTLKEFFEERRRRIFTYAIAILSVAFSVWYSLYGLDKWNYMVYFEGPSFVFAFALVLFVKTIAGERTFKQKTVSILKNAGEGIMLTFLLEPELRGGFHFIFAGLEKYITWFPAVSLQLVAAMLAGMVLAWLIHKIPVVGKLI